MRLQPVFARRPPPLWCVPNAWWPGSLAGRAMARIKMVAAAAGVGRASAAHICMRVFPLVTFFPWLMRNQITV